MPNLFDQSQNTFIIRFWREWQGENTQRRLGWRGRIEHIQSGEGMVFSEQQQMLAFIERFVHPLSMPPEEGEKRF